MAIMSPFIVTADFAEKTLAAVVRALNPGQSWAQVRRLVEARRVSLNGETCRDPARRVHEGERIELLARPPAAPTPADALVIRHLDEHLVVVEKPAGMNTVRHPAERSWGPRRKALSPTLEDLVLARLARLDRRPRKSPRSRLRVVQRLDKETSGLLVFARSVVAERGLGKQFHAHSVERRYLAIVPGFLPPQRVATRLVRDRGDGRRGSTDVPGVGKEAVTHVEVVERLRGYTLLLCRLETGRTHQIRIHLAELGHPVCGEKVYDRRATGEPLPSCSDSPRLALHASELGFTHPVTRAAMRWSMPLPPDLSAFLERLRGPVAATAE
jgi:23S rRNA pseudouridine1911/1915/1917 synthase